MKKLFVVTVSIFLLNFSLSAQDIKFGVVGGANLSNVDYSFDFPNKKPRISYHIGVFTEIPLSPKFNFKPEIVYTSIGYVYKTNASDYEYFRLNPVIPDDYSFKNIIKYNYLVIPLNIRWNLGEKFCLNFGPQIGFLLNTVYKFKGSSSTPFEDERTRYSGDFKLDYGATLGVGYKINENLEIGLRYYRGLKNLYDNSFIGGDTKVYNSVFQLSASYAIF